MECQADRRMSVAAVENAAVGWKLGLLVQALFLDC